MKTGNPAVKATTYVKEDKLLISVASWADEPVSIKFDINWETVGIDKSVAIFKAPEIKNFQPQRTYELDEAIPIEPTKGWLIIVNNK